LFSNQYHIKVTRTARYYTLGEVNSKTKNAWIVLHGHKQLANEFIKVFDELAVNGDYIIAPEALSRFYVKGDYGDVGATWMTKEDRENEISDYVNYLDELFDKVIKSKKEKSPFNINAIGFSQGAATLSRWLAYGKSKVDRAIFWCGNLAHDVDYSKSGSFRNTQIHLIFGKNDPYFPGDYYKSQIELLNKYGIEPHVQLFEGGHEISTKLVREARVA